MRDHMCTLTAAAQSDKKEERSDKYPAESLAAPPLKT